MSAQGRHDAGRVLRAAALYFAAVFSAGFVLGLVRELVLVPQIGSRAAELLEMPVMAAVMILSARWVVQRFALPSQARYRLAVGFSALALLLILEFGLVLPLRGMSFADYWSSVDRVSGSVYYALLVLYAFLPELIQRKSWYSAHAMGLGSAALSILVFGVGYGGYLADMEHATERITDGSRLVQTSCGAIEYGEKGSGPAVLVVHGAGGGYDQGIEFGEELAGRGFRVVAPSRFGYLRTPVPVDASPEAQADAHACLLDALGIERAAIVGVSAGGPSTLQFALRHPQRTNAMVLVAPLAYMPRESSAEPLRPTARFMYEHAVKSDVLYWLAMRIAPGVVVKTILGTPPEVLVEASAEDKERVERLMEHILPLSRRQPGLLNDAAVAQSLAPLPLEKIAARTLVISARDDLYGTYESAGYTASRIGGARFIGYMRGGHTLVGHDGATMNETAAFLRTDSSLARQ